MDRSWGDNNVSKIEKLPSSSLRGSIKSTFVSFELNELNIFSFSYFNSEMFETLIIAYIIT